MLGWDYGFFISKNNLFQNQDATSTERPNETKIVRCASCNQPIGTISTTLYKIEGKQFCADCYSKKIINQAVERDNSETKKEKSVLSASV
jgi:formylmethanofuran dehydrogenase subunit E